MTRRRLLGNATSAAVQTVTSAFLLFFLYRYLLQELGAQQLGVWSVVLASVSIGRLTDMGFAGTALKFVATALGEGEPERAGRLLQTASYSIAMIMLCALALALPAIEIVLDWALPSEAIKDAEMILPLALTSLLFTLIAGVFQSGVDACHRMYLKNLLLIAGNVLMIALALLLVPHRGLMGIAIAQCIQAAFLMLGSWLILRRLLPTLPWLPAHWRYSEFREMVGYATNFQLGMVAGLLFEPLTKILLARFGDLSVTAYFDMANQLVQKAKAVITSAQQALVPELATIREENKTDREALFMQAYGVSFVLVVPYFMGLMLSFPLVSWLWIGHFQADFILFGSLMSAGWMIASLSAVSYFYNQATAQLIWNTLNHVATGALNFLLGFFIGTHFGGAGVVLAAMVSIAVPNILLNLLVFNRLGLGLRQTVPGTFSKTLLMITATAVGSGAAGHALGWFAGGALSSAAVVFLFAIALLGIFFSDPRGRGALSRLSVKGVRL